MSPLWAGSIRDRIRPDDRPNEAERLRRRPRDLAQLAAAAVAFPLAGWAFWSLVLGLGSNDFHDYWLAGRLILQGHSPYDMAALQSLAQSEHLSFTLGGGYSYPLPFALAMAPLAVLPFGLALAVFNVVSLAAFGLTVAVWVEWAHGRFDASRRRRLALALAAGVYAPVYGTVVMGQANLILFPLLGLGAVLVLDGTTVARRFWGGAMLGLAAVVKLVPGALVVPLALGRRKWAAAGIAVGALGTLALAALAVPWAAAGSSGLASLFDPDPFYTNQSINGFITRLVSPSDRTVPIWNEAFDPRPVMLALTAAFGLITLLILWRARSGLADRRGAAIGLGLTLVAAISGAPKESFWNQAIALVAVGLLLTVEVPDLNVSRFSRIDRGLLCIWFGSAILWAAQWAVEPSAAGQLGPVVTLLWSSSLYGMFALWWLMARRLAAPPLG
jgi:Glycosyltransferase family 87